ncbi:polyadenylate-binding protein 8-like [Iris pallida]|uniref:Polyadenylate-binding protein 8-like n=1 Tax=Iris pallida TaxID=29817 RepID=A0AAX6FS19_IRIPA|nr:polyadenylate-binding protein 8-like [Iris pallida]
MNGKMIGSKPLHVAIAQRKEDRRARLQAQFSQMRPVVIPANIAPRMPVYPHGAPGLGNNCFMVQAPPALIRPQQFGYQQPPIPGMRPGGAPKANFFVPMVQQGQQPQRPGGRRAGGGPGANASAADDSKGWSGLSLSFRPQHARCSNVWFSWWNAFCSL